MCVLVARCLKRFVKSDRSACAVGPTQLLAPMIPFVGFQHFYGLGVGSARFDARAAYSVGVPRAGHCACAQCCTEPRGGGNTHTDFSLYENALAFNPRSRPAPGEVDHQYPRLRPKYPPPPPNSSSSTTIIRINSIGVSFNCAGVIASH